VVALGTKKLAGRFMNEQRRIELKYPIAPELADQVRAWAREHLDRDPYGSGAHGDSYEVHTVYFDTPNLDLYRRSGAARRTKYRVRRYEDASCLWLESKSKKRSVVRKTRTMVDRQELMDRVKTEVSSPDCPGLAWHGEWFFERTSEIGMRPTANLTYQRFARTATLEGRPLRLTIDRQLRATHVACWEPIAMDSTSHPSLVVTEVLELKFSDFMPHLFKQLLLEFPLAGRGFSKYRTAMGYLTGDHVITTSALSRCG
jgi:hypothetical protein